MQKPPPQFVPTLTHKVERPAGLVKAANPANLTHAGASPIAATALTPAVPTPAAASIPEVAAAHTASHPASQTATSAAVPDSATPAAAQISQASLDAVSFQLQQRVLQNVTESVMRHVETALEKHVREAVAGVALAHAKAIAHELAPAIEGIVTDMLGTALQDALAKELADKSGYR